MTVLYFFIFVLILQLPLESNCIENNVCTTIKDYYTIKKNKNCKYEVAADPEADPRTIIELNGYPAEIHKVTTLDGYILTMFRIPNNQVTSKKPKGPVFLQHAIHGSAINFLGLGKDSLAFLLADAGYDVWLGSFRGTEYSEEHVNLTVYDNQYWDYSIDEVGLYDMPTQLNYVSNATGNEGNIVFLGHALGSTFGLLYTSTYPEEARKILKLQILLAPAASLPNTKAPLFKYLGPFFRPFLKIIMENNLIRFVSQAKILKAMSRRFCLKSPIIMQQCNKAVNILFTGPRGQIDSKTLPVVFNAVPAGSSFKMIAHIADAIKGNFRRYDYGTLNFKIYGSSEPPPYDLGKIEVPTFVAYAMNDWICTPEDTRNIYKNLSSKAKYREYEITDPNFNHADFVHGSNAKSIIYDIVLQVLDDLE